MALQKKNVNGKAEIKNNIETQIHTWSRTGGRDREDRQDYGRVTSQNLREEKVLIKSSQLTGEGKSWVKRLPLSLCVVTGYWYS